MIVNNHVRILPKKRKEFKAPNTDFEFSPEKWVTKLMKPMPNLHWKDTMNKHWRKELQMRREKAAKASGEGEWPRRAAEASGQGE